MNINRYISKQFSNPKGLGGRLVSLMMNRQNRPLYKAVIQELSLTGLDKVLDVGCGNGFVLNLLAKEHQDHFVGIDLSNSAIHSARWRNRRFVKSQTMDFICADVAAMPFADGSFSKAYTINTVYFWDDLDTALMEIWRILKDDGIFINTLYSEKVLGRHPHTRFGYKKYSTEQLAEAGIKAGFTVWVVPLFRGAAYNLVYQKSRRPETD